MLSKLDAVITDSAVDHKGFGPNRPARGCVTPRSGTDSPKSSEGGIERADIKEALVIRLG